MPKYSSDAASAPRFHRPFNEVQVQLENPCLRQLRSSRRAINHYDDFPVRRARRGEDRGSSPVAA
jgi:hypothetical protein